MVKAVAPRDGPWKDFFLNENPVVVATCDEIKILDYHVKKCAYHAHCCSFNSNSQYTLTFEVLLPASCLNVAHLKLMCIALRHEAGKIASNV